jgi:rhomboid protease GluP
MLERRTSGAVNCYACEKLVSVDAEKCVHCGAENPGLWGYAHILHRFKYNYGFANLITWTCIALYGLTLLTDSGGITNQLPYNILAPSGWSLIVFGATGAYPCFLLGRWWTVLSAEWLHGNLFHIGFNLAWLQYLVPLAIDAYGAARLVILYTVSGCTASVLSTFVAAFLPNLPPLLQGAGVSVGASGALFGLFGALVVYGQKMGRETFKQQILIYAAVGFFGGFVMGNVDNWGHLGGFLGGYGLSQTPWFNPRRSQKISDIILAILCLGLTLASFIASVIHGLIWLGSFR